MFIIRGICIIMIHSADYKLPFTPSIEVILPETNLTHHLFKHFFTARLLGIGDLVEGNFSRTFIP